MDRVCALVESSKYLVNMRCYRIRTRMCSCGLVTEAVGLGLGRLKQPYALSGAKATGGVRWYDANMGR